MSAHVLERGPLRLQLTVAVSLGAHCLLLGLYGSKPFQPEARKMKLTEVEFQAEAGKPTEIEKLMTRLAVPAKGPNPAARQGASEAALVALQKESFSQTVGLPKARPLAEITESDLTRLAKLPKLDVGPKPAIPSLAEPAPKTIALVRSQTSEQEALAAKVAPLDALPPADFGPDISRRGFEQPELIIKKVKAERREAPGGAGTPKTLTLKHDEFISGEVKSRDLLHRESPAVPRWLEEKGIEAEVIIRFVVNPDGEVGDRLVVEKTSGYAELDQLAMVALKKFVFAPLSLTVKQVEQDGTIVMRFTLKNR